MAIHDSPSTTVTGSPAISTPLTSPSPSPQQPQQQQNRSLSDRINASTRISHSRLNRLIISRLPLCLPPATSSPSTYLTALLFVLPIYVAFESFWKEAIAPAHQQTASLDSYSGGPGFNHGELCRMLKVSPRIRAVLSDLFLEDLLREERLKADVKSLSNLDDDELPALLTAVTGFGVYASFIDHIATAVRDKPHILLAYLWVMYMALFSGGRFLRATLQDAGPRFWSGSPTDVHPFVQNLSSERRASEKKLPLVAEQEISDPTGDGCAEKNTPVACLNFFNFSGDNDGEDIKLEFKRRFAHAEDSLEEHEKVDIILEAQEIFTSLTSMVSELDSIFKVSF